MSVVRGPDHELGVPELAAALVSDILLVRGVTPFRAEKLGGICVRL
jgi:hypothetical protein